MTVGDSDPEAIGPEGIEVADLAGGIPGLGRAAALSGQEFDDRIPITVPAKVMGHRLIAKMNLTALEPQLRPISPGAELYVADFLGVDWRHGNRVPVRPTIARTSLGSRPKSSRK